MASTPTTKIQYHLPSYRASRDYFTAVFLSFYYCVNMNYTYISNKSLFAFYIIVPEEIIGTEVMLINCMSLLHKLMHDIMHNL